MEDTLLTIAVLNYNGLHRLKKTVPSYVDQNYDNYEIVLVDNGSTDGSIDYLKAFHSIRVIENNKNLGYNVGKNRLVLNSKGKYVLMLDNDIELGNSNFLVNIYNSYLSLEKPAFLSPLMKSSNTDVLNCNGLYYTKLQRSCSFKELYKTGVIKIPACSGGAIFFEKKTFLELGMYDEIYPFNLDDYDICARAYLMGYNNYVDNNLYVIHHGVQEKVSLTSLSWKYRTYYSGFCRMIWKNYRFKNILVWWPLSSLWITIKALKTVVKTKSIKPLLSHVTSVIIFIKDFQSTICLRRSIQKRRAVIDDIFLKM